MNQIVFQSIDTIPTRAGQYLGINSEGFLVTFSFLPKEWDGTIADPHYDSKYWNQLVYDYSLLGWIHTHDIVTRID